MNNINLEKALMLRKNLHRNAEASGNEVKTKKILMDFLDQNTDLEIIDMGKWFYAVKNGTKSGNVIAFRADMDAVLIDETIDIEYSSTTKNVSHKCGHDGHCAVLCALALELNKINMCNTIYFIFQHSEETGAGAKECCEGLERIKIDEIYGFHNIPSFKTGEILIKTDTFAYSSCGVKISLIGEPTHAAYPDNSKNPCFAFTRMINRFDELTENLSGKAYVTVICLNSGKPTFGTAAGDGVLMLTVRAELEKELNLIIERLKSIAYDSSENMKCNIDLCDEFPETYNDYETVLKVKSICQGNALSFTELKAPMRWSEDFGHYLKNIKGAYIGIGSRENHAELHTENYDFPDEIIPYAVKLFKLIAEY